jgi:hypothetical protein
VDPDRNHAPQPGDISNWIEKGFRKYWVKRSLLYIAEF